MCIRDRYIATVACLVAGVIGFVSVYATDKGKERREAEQEIACLLYTSEVRLEETLIKRVMPNSLEAEQSVIGSMIMDQDAIVTRCV